MDTTAIDWPSAMSVMEYYGKRRSTLDNVDRLKTKKLGDGYEKRNNRSKALVETLWMDSCFDDDTDALSHLKDLHRCMPWLRELVLDCNNLQSLPELSGLTRLKSLRLFRNNLPSVPTSFACLTSLTHLNLCHNALEDISPLAACVGLRSLLLNDNRISYIPWTFTALVNLERLYLVRNNISVLPSEFGCLTKLHDLRINMNQLRFFPAELWRAAIGFELNPYFEAFDIFSQIYQITMRSLYWLHPPWDTPELIIHDTLFKHKEFPILKCVDARRLAGVVVKATAVVAQPHTLFECAARVVLNRNLLRLKLARAGAQPLLPRDLAQHLRGPAQKRCAHCTQLYLTPGSYVVSPTNTTERMTRTVRSFIPLCFPVCSQRCAMQRGAVHWSVSSITPADTT